MFADARIVENTVSEKKCALRILYGFESQLSPYLVYHYLSLSFLTCQKVLVISTSYFILDNFIKLYI